jgi:hypothetical protein
VNTCIKEMMMMMMIMMIENKCCLITFTLCKQIIYIKEQVAVVCVCIRICI